MKTDIFFSSFEGMRGEKKTTQIFRMIVKRMSIPFEQVCENTCSIDLSVTANLAPSFQSPFVIGSSSFVTLIFTVINIGIDPAYLPVLKIPLGTKRILQTPARCRNICIFSPLVPSKGQKNILVLLS